MSITIENVTFYIANNDRLRGGHVDHPRVDSVHEGFAFGLAGWVLGQDAPVTALMIRAGNHPIKTIPVTNTRPDVAAQFPDIRYSEQCGFSTEISVIGLPPKATISLIAEFDESQSIPFAEIRLRHERLISGYQPQLQPLSLTAVGRSGTTWLMHLLSKHRQLIAHDEYPHEVRAAAYWMHMLMMLSDPSNHLRGTHTPPYPKNIWWAERHPTKGNFRQSDHLQRWFRRDYVKGLAEFCQQNCDAFYRHAASAQQRDAPVYFVEKTPPSAIQWIFRELYTGAREIFLIRDPRDILSSAIAFNTKRGYPAFGRDLVESDAALVEVTRERVSHALEAWHARAEDSQLVRYEDLVTQPGETLRQILDYLALDSTSATIDQMIAAAQISDEKLDFHRTSPTAAGSIGRWKHDLSAEMQSLCHEVFADLLHESGYTT